MRRLGTSLAVGALALVGLFATTAAAGDNHSGFKTDAAKMLVGQNGWTTEAIISVGDTLPGGYLFEGIPDGIAIANVNGRGTADILVNHELSLVPFPATRQDNLNATVSRLRLNQHSAGVMKGDYVIPQSAGYQRFCSNFLVGPEHGFERELLLTNEEARDIVLRQADSWHQPGVSLAEPGAEQAGVVVAYDVKSGAYRSIYGMGRHNHENAVGIPGYGYPVVVSGDDTFVSNPPESQLYMYLADDGDDVWNDRGTLYAFVADGKTTYYDVEVGDDVSGHFVEVPKTIATGKKADGSDITSADVAGIDPPPAGVPDGPQWVLDQWGNAENNTHDENVFDFVRIEDIAYDRNDPQVVYLADSGRGSGSSAPNGRIWKMVLDPSDPTDVVSLSILIEGSDATGQAGDIHQPDNLETTKDSLLIQEDPSTANQFVTPARIWRYDLTSGEKEVVAAVNATGPSTNLGSWESSGIVDASSILGPGAFLATVQAHGWDETVSGGNDAPAVPKREHGQLLLLRAPGS